MTRLLLAAGILAITPALLVVAGLVSIVDERRKRREYPTTEHLHVGATWDDGTRWREDEISEREMMNPRVDA